MDFVEQVWYWVWQQCSLLLQETPCTCLVVARVRVPLLMISGSWICPQGNGPALSQLERIRLPRLSQQWSTTKECWCCLVVGPILRHSHCIRYINHSTLLVPYEQFEIKVIWDNYFKLYVLQTALCLLSQEKFLECNTLYVLQTVLFSDLRRNPWM